MTLTGDYFSWHNLRSIVLGVDLERSSAFKSSENVYSDWYTHPNVGSDGFSLQDYQIDRRRFVSYQRGPFKFYGTSLKYYDGLAAWDEFGGTPSSAVELPKSVAVKHVECIKGFCL